MWKENDQQQRRNLVHKIVGMWGVEMPNERLAVGMLTMNVPVNKRPCLERYLEDGGPPEGLAESSHEIR
jgi:hypothetical protein